MQKMDTSQITRIPYKYLAFLNTLDEKSVGKIFINILGGSKELDNSEIIIYNLIMTDVDNINGQAMLGSKQGHHGNKGGRPKVENVNMGGVDIETPRGGKIKPLIEINKDNIIQDKINIDKQINNNFDTFRNLYPIKKDKKKAQDKFKKVVNGKNFDIVIEGLKNYIKEIEITKTTFIKHPTSRLNGECRNDVYKTRVKTFKDYTLEEQYEMIDKIKEKGGTVYDMIMQEYQFENDEVYQEYYEGYKAWRKEIWRKEQKRLMGL